MRQTHRYTLSAFTALGLFAFLAGPASAQDFLNSGSIQMGARGPVGVLGGGNVISGNGGQFNTGLGRVNVGANGATGTINSGIVNGRFGIGQDGVNLDTNLGSFGFALPGGNNNGIVPSATQGGVNMGSSGYGPQGQAPGGYSTGAGSFGTAYSSAGDTGAFGRESLTTNTKFQGNSRRTGKNNQAIYERLENNLLSTFSVDPRAVPSGSFSYGFPTGAGAYVGTGRGAFTRGWYLPPTSTGSFDGNIVSP